MVATRSCGNCEYGKARYPWAICQECYRRERWKRRKPEEKGR